MSGPPNSRMPASGWLRTRPHSVLLKNCCFARLTKLFTVQGAWALSSWMPMSPRFVEMVALITGGLVDTRPAGGGLTCLAGISGVAGYWQLAPRSAGGANAGNGGTAGADGVGDPVGFGIRARVGALNVGFAEGLSLCEVRAIT